MTTKVRREIVRLANGVEISEASPYECAWRQVLRPDAEDVTVAGTVFVYGSDIGVMLTNQDVFIGYLAGSLPSWWKVALRSGTTVRLRFGAAGAIATTSSGRVVSSAPQIAQKLVDVASSHPTTVSDLLAGGSVSMATSKAYFKSRQMMALPGTAIGSASKAANVQGAAGYTSLLAGSTVPSYVILRFSPAVGTTSSNANTQLSSPVYFGFQAANIPTAPQEGPAPTGLKFGDLSAFAQAGPAQLTFSFVINYNVTSVGLWYPALEVGTDAAALKYSAFDVTLYTLSNLVMLPLNGLVGGRPSGSSVGGMSGTLGGSGATGGSGLTAVVM